MKTPRELLLNRHQHATPKLDAIRRHVVAEHATPTAMPELDTAGLLSRLWQELVLPCRWAWSGLAAAWILILPLHLATNPHDTSPADPRLAQAAIPLNAALLAEQFQMRAELLGLLPAPQEQSPPEKDTNLSPRSEDQSAPKTTRQKPDPIPAGLPSSSWPATLV